MLPGQVVVLAPMAFRLKTGSENVDIMPAFPFSLGGFRPPQPIIGVAAGASPFDTVILPGVAQPGNPSTGNVGPNFVLIQKPGAGSVLMSPNSTTIGINNAPKPPTPLGLQITPPPGPGPSPWPSHNQANSFNPAVPTGVQQQSVTVLGPNGKPLVTVQGWITPPTPKPPQLPVINIPAPNTALLQQIQGQTNQANAPLLGTATWINLAAIGPNAISLNIAVNQMQQNVVNATGYPTMAAAQQAINQANANTGLLQHPNPAYGPTTPSYALQQAYNAGFPDLVSFIAAVNSANPNGPGQLLGPTYNLQVPGGGWSNMQYNANGIPVPPTPRRLNLGGAFGAGGAMASSGTLGGYSNPGGGGGGGGLLG